MEKKTFKRVVTVMPEKENKTTPDADPEKKTCGRGGRPEPVKNLYANMGECWDEPDEALPQADCAPVFLLDDGSPGQCLFYRGTIGAVMGTPSAGKSVVGLAAALAEVRAGGFVWWADPEDSKARFKARLKRFGCTKDEASRIIYIWQPDCGEMSKMAADLEEADPAPTLIWLDGVAMLMSQDGIKENDADDIKAWFLARLRPLKRKGAAVVFADHVTKDPKSRGLWGRGSGAKGGDFDGSAYMLVEKCAFGIKKAGHVELWLSKDRHSGIGVKGQKVFEMHVRPTDDGGRQEISWRDLRESGEEREARFRPTEIMAEILKYVRREKAGAGQSAILGAVPGRNQTKTYALALMEAEGALRREDKGQRKIYFVGEKVGSWDPKLAPVAVETKGEKEK